MVGEGRYPSGVRSWLIAATLLLGGCSFVTGASGSFDMHAPLPATGDLPCDHAGIVGIDTVAAVVALGLAGITWTEAPDAFTANNPGYQEARILEVSLPVTGLVYAASAVYGAHMTARCRRAAASERHDVASSAPR